MSDTKNPQPIDVQEQLQDEDTKALLEVIARRFNTTRKDVDAMILAGMNQPGIQDINNRHARHTVLREKPSATRQHALIDELEKHYDIMLVESTHKLYYRKHEQEQDQEQTIGWDDTKIYRVFPDYVQRRELMKIAASLPTPMRIDAKEARATAETMVERIGGDEDKVREYIDNAVVQITNNLFWDGHIGQLTESPSHEAYRRLFDTTTGDESTVKWTEEQEAEWNADNTEIIIKGHYKKVLEALEKSNGKLPQTDDLPVARIKYIEEWANGNYDTYMDMLRAIASCFLKKKPRGSYFLIGVGANGKSCYNDLIRTLFGKNNCARVALDDLNNAHVNMALANCIANLPDEQEDITLKQQKDFKSIAAHEEVDLEVYYSQEPQPVRCNFMCFYPMNHFPEWDGPGAKACLDRCWPIFFTRDFSKESTHVENFQYSTYTPENMQRLVPVVLALAAYHTKHPLEKSKTMERNKGVIEAETNSATVYRNRMFTYFNAFKNIKWLYQDYMAWCNDMGVPYEKQREFKTFILTNTREEWVYVPDLKKTEKCLVTAAWTKDNSCVLHPKSVMDARGLTMEELYMTDKDRVRMRSAVSIKEALTNVPSKIEGEPDPLPPSKLGTSIDWVKEHNKAKADKEV